MATQRFPLIFGCLVVGASCAAGAWSAPVAEVPLRRLVPPLLAAPVTIGGQERWLILDTGAKRSMITSRLADELGLRPRARYEIVSPVGGVLHAFCAGPVMLRLGDLPLPVECLGWVPSEPGIAFPSGASGILGVDALRKIEVLLDARRARLWVGAPGGLMPLVAGEVVPVRNCDCLPALAGEVRLRGGRARLPALLVVDSGASDPLIFGATGQALAAGGAPAGNYVLETAAGRGVNQAAVIEITLAGRRLRPGSAALLPDVRDREEDGLLPATLLGPFLLDLPGSRIVLGAHWRAGAPRLAGATRTP